MSKPTPLTVSAPVRRRPPVSTEEIREEKNYPPVIPPQRVALDFDPVPLQLRRLRVAHGSRRGRDLAAVAMAEELERLEQLATTPDDCRAALRAWVVARRSLRRALPRSTYHSWIRPLRPAGTAGASTLVLSGPEGVRAWVERRYTALIGVALQGTGFERVEFVAAGSAA